MASAMNDSPGLLLSGEFQVREKADHPVSVKLTDRGLEVTFKNNPKRSQITYLLGDIIGASVEKQNAVLLKVFAYPQPAKTRFRSACRDRRCPTFVINCESSEDLNLSLAERWRCAIIRSSRGLDVSKEALGTLPDRRRFLLYVNPASGKGRAERFVRTTISPMLDEASVDSETIISTSPRFAEEHARRVDLTGVDCIVSVSGDGMLNEILNGLLARDDWRKALAIPLCALPAGSGNALAAAVLHASGERYGFLEAMVVLLTGRPVPLDVLSLTTANRRMYGFLSIAWGMISDIDIETEKYRKLGSARFTVGFVQRVTALRRYQGILSYLPAQEKSPEMCDVASIPTETSTRAVGLGGDKVEGKASSVLSTDCLPPFDSDTLPDSWKVMDDRFLFAAPVSISHLGWDMFMFPSAGLNDGLLHLAYATAEMKRRDLVKSFTQLGAGMLKTPGEYNRTQYVHAAAFRLDPAPGVGHIALDGEEIEYGRTQGQVHRGLARVMARIPQASTAV